MILPDAEAWARVCELFQAAGRLDADERARYLELACPDDPQIVDEVLELLAHADPEGDPIRAAVGQAAVDFTRYRRRS